MKDDANHLCVTLVEAVPGGFSAAIDKSAAVQICQRYLHDSSMPDLDIDIRCFEQ